ncbi:MAG: hypothetical protein AAGN35_18100 [Bacteroidota bacterium]
MSYTFAKATVTENVEGGLNAEVSCLNGLVAPPGSTYSLSDNPVYHDGESISAGDVILFRVSGGGVLDNNNIYPYNPATGSPLRLGGGIGKGNIIEEDASPTVRVAWVNGLNASGTIDASQAEGADQLPVDTAVYFLCQLNESSVFEVTSVAVSEGTCGDVPAGPSEFNFNGVGQTAY